MPSILGLLLTGCPGKNLPAKDADGYSDPYLRVICGNYSSKTKVIKKNLNPVWTDKLEIPESTDADTLIIECWDWDLVGVRLVPLVTFLTLIPTSRRAPCSS